MPPQLAWAENVLALAERFGQLPRVIEQEDASLLRLVALTHPDCGKAKE